MIEIFFQNWGRMLCHRFGSTIVLLLLVPDLVMAAQIKLQPVLATGAYSISGNQISVQAGASVALEIKASSWGPALLKTFQMQVNSTGYSSGTSGSLTPAGYPATPQIGAFFLRNRPDHVFFSYNIATIMAIDFSTLNYRWGGTLFDGSTVLDTGVERYVGSLVLNVPLNATGVFTIGFTQGLGITFLADDDNNEILPLLHVPAVIKVFAQDCNDNNLPDSVDISNATSADCNENLIPDECDIGMQATGKKIYWMKGSAIDSIERSNFDGTHVEALYEDATQFPNGLAIDPVGGKLYWTDDFDDRIYGASLDGSGRIVLSQLGASSLPSGIAIDLTSGKIYWGERSPSTRRIRKANLDGSGIEDILFDIHPVGIALDPIAEKIYWTQQGPASIRRANLNGSGVEILVASGLATPGGLALDTFAGKLYWTDQDLNVIRRANLDGSNIENLVTTGLSAPKGIALDLEGSKMYWTESNRIRRANLNGTGGESVLSTSDPFAIAVDATSSDCNANGIPDDCDLTFCPGLADCDDCNENGLLDQCDITTGVSSDSNPLDGVPDECVANLAPAGDWSDNIWGLSGVNPANPYPDNQDAVPNLHVTLNDSAVFLNVAAEIDSLHLTNGAQLSATQVGAEGDLTFAFPGEVSIEATVAVGSRQIGEPVDTAIRPDVVLGPNGKYLAEPSVTNPTAELFTADLTIVGGNCEPPCKAGGELSLTGTMFVEVNGNLFLDGRSSLCSGPCEFARLGGVTPPPKLRLADSSGIGILGNWVMASRTEVNVQPGASVRLAGSLLNECVTPEDFDFSGGQMILTGSTSRTFEVAGRDYGPDPEGFSSTNFLIDKLEIESGGYVEFVNRFPNMVPLAPCEEVLYVRHLIFGAGSTVIVNNCKVYYESLESNGVVATVLGECASFQNQVLPLADPTGINKARSIGVLFPIQTLPSGGTQAVRVRLASLHHVAPPYTGGPATDFSSFEGQVRWLGPPLENFESVASSIPFYASRLQCTPHYQNWSTVGLVHVFGSAVTPSSSYEVQVFSGSCQGIETTCSSVSPILTASTSRWGDLEVPFNPPSQPAQPDLGDVAALVKKFRDLPDAPIKARAVLAGDDAFGNFNALQVDVGFNHIAACVDAFRGKPYPYTIAACP